MLTLKLPRRVRLQPLLTNILVCAALALILTAGCSGGGNNGLFVPTPTPAPTLTRPTPTPSHPLGANFTFSAVSSDFNGNVSPFTGGTGSFTRRKTATTDGLDATVSSGTNPTRSLTISISTAGALSVGQTIPLGVNDAGTSSTDITYSESRPDQTQNWVSQGGPGVGGSVTVVALNATAVSLRLSGARLSRRDGNGPSATGAFTLNGNLTVPSA